VSKFLKRYCWLLITVSGGILLYGCNVGNENKAEHTEKCVYVWEKQVVPLLTEPPSGHEIKYAELINIQRELEYAMLNLDARMRTHSKVYFILLGPKLSKVVVLLDIPVTPKQESELAKLANAAQEMFDLTSRGVQDEKALMECLKSNGLE
jgi:hypothetical protein